MEITFRQFQLESKNDQSECYDRKRANQNAEGSPKTPF